MAYICRNEDGAVAVNDRVLQKLIIENVLGMSDDAVLCTKKGKIIRSRLSPFVAPDYYEAIELVSKRNRYSITVYCLLKKRKSFAEIADMIISAIEADFTMLKVSMPENMEICFKGIADEEPFKKAVSISRSYE